MITIMEAIWLLKDKGYEVKQIPNQEKMFRVKGGLFFIDGVILSARALIGLANRSKQETDY